MKTSIRITSAIIALIITLSLASITAFAQDSTENIEPGFKFSDEDYSYKFSNFNSGIMPLINSNGSFTYSFNDRLHSGHFTATSSSILMNFNTTTNTSAWYYIALYDVTDDPIDPTYKSITKAKDDKKAEHKTFNVKKGRTYRLTFSKVNLKNDSTVKGYGTLSDVKVN